MQARAESWFQFESGVGASIYTRQGQGAYYSPPFPYKAPTIAPAFRVGVQINAWHPDHWRPGVRFHADYINFGKVSWDALSPQDEGDFTARGMRGGYDMGGRGCIENNCGQMSRFESYGRIQSVAFTVEPYWNLGGGWTVGVEAGPAISRTTWMTHATVLNDGFKLGPPGTVHTLSTSPKLSVGIITGASVSYKAFTLRYNYLFGRSSGGSADNEQMPGIVGAHLVTLNYTF
ncbi:hypothetical protein [Burkholderia ubonensis]|uniref:hypothetical protein n=1 Tax=Burkholderia ubonensis TaxID=101571 RepID=UPI00075F4EFF|nr:hypothetical protein [Burkholderia ubonensis]